MLKTLFLVFVGGGAGTLARFGVGRMVSLSGAAAFPYGTIAVNVLGGFLIGFLWGWPEVASRPAWVHLLIVGFCGGFTTFSAFSWESLSMLRQGNILAFALYVSGSVAICLFSAWGGYVLGRALGSV